MSRRVNGGRRLDGSFGLEVALEGSDALTDDRFDSGKFSFSSDWTDITAVASIGVTDAPVFSSGSSTIIIPINDYGYIPHAEVRMVEGLRIWDDTWIDGKIGIGAFIHSNRLQINLSASPFRMLYLIYREASALQ